MRKLTLEEIHTVTLDVMDRIHKICKENDIRYTLMFGTLIGALRHQGFIPWDDDFDICMLREDYNRFCEITSKEKGRYRLANRALTKDYYHGISRYYDAHYEYHNELAVKPCDLGIFVDIYPLDSCGKTLKETQKVHHIVEQRNMEYNIYCNKYSLSNRRNNLLRVPYHYYLHLKYGPDFSQQVDRIIENTITSHFDADSRYVGVYWEPRKDFMLFERSLFLDCELHAFEDRRYWIPKESFKILTQYYGDFMQLPPESERVTTHDYSICERREPI